MYASSRPLDTYCPFADMEARYPEWSIRLVPSLPDGAREVFLPRRKTLVLSKELHDKDPENYATASGDLKKDYQRYFTALNK